MIGYKLLRKKKNGELTPLFINKTQVIPIGETLPAECYPTKGFAIRPGWHICSKPEAPHLKTEGRVWAKVQFKRYYRLKRPASQGGVWFIARDMKVLEVLDNEKLLT